MPRWIGVVLVAGCCVPWAAFALADDDTPPPDASPQNQSSEEPPTLSTVVRAPKPVQSASEHRIGRDVLSATPRASAGEALRTVPGLVVSQHGGEGKAHQLFLRGFDAVHGQDVEIEVGGLPVNSPSHVHALGYADLSFVAPELISTIEAFEGPYGVDQGDYAVAGTLRLSLAAPGPGAFGSLTLGQYGQRGLLAGWAASDPRSFAALELGSGEGKGPARAFGRASFLAQHRFEAGGLAFRTFAGAYTTRFDTPGVLRLDELDRLDFFATHDPRQGGSSDRQHLLLEAGTKDGRSTATLFALRQSATFRQNFTGFWFDPRGDGLEQTHDATTVGLTLRHAHRTRIAGLRASLEAGAGARHDVIDQGQRGYRHVDGAVFADTPRARAWEIGQSHAHAFTRARLLPGRWRLALGLRADALGVRLLDALAPDGERRASFGTRWGLEAGVSRLVGRHGRLFLQYGEGFRTPHAASLADGERAPFVSVHGAELGFRRDSRRLSFSSSLFASRVANDVFFDHTVSTTVPVGSTLRSGLSAAVVARPVSGLVLAASGTAAHALTLESSTLLPGFVPFVARADAGWERPLTKELFLFAGAGFTGVGPRPLRFGDFGASYALADLRLSLAWRRVALRLDVRNLLDVRWRDGEFTFPSAFGGSESASALPARHFTAGHPRTVSLSLELRPESP